MEKCRNCGGTYTWNNYCGAYVCDSCDDHKDLARCFCGWNLDRGEVLEDDVDMSADDIVGEDDFI